MTLNILERARKIEKPKWHFQTLEFNDKANISLIRAIQYIINYNIMHCTSSTGDKGEE